MNVSFHSAENLKIRYLRNFKHVDPERQSENFTSIELFHEDKEITLYFATPEDLRIFASNLLVSVDTVETIALGEKVTETADASA